MSDKKKVAESVEMKPAKVDVEAFIQRKMKAINEMQDHDTARYLAEKVLSNRKEA